MDVESAIAAFAADDTEVPREAVQWTFDHWDEAAPRLLDVLARYADGVDRSREAANAVFCIVHLVAEKREARAFAPLCRLALDSEAIELALGDIITESLPNMLISIYDGDLAALKQVIEAAETDEFVRDSFLGVLAYLTASGRVPRDDTEVYLRRLYNELRPQEESYVWVGWAFAVAMLGLDALSDVVHAAFERGLVDLSAMDEEDFQSALQKARAASDPLSPFEDEGVGPLDDAVGELARWYKYLQAEALAYRDPYELADEEVEAIAGPWFDAPEEPAINPYRGVGRNDPCPCGSGKKFKKCCLPGRPA
jgi:hypothetical protein